MDALHNQTAHELVDRILQGVAGAFALAFPQQLLALYLTGSWSNGTGVYHAGDAYNSSDLDLHLVFRSPFLPSDRERAKQFMSACRHLRRSGSAC